MTTRWARPLSVIAAIAFFISAVFPLGAGLSRDTSKLPRWWGAADVTLAFVVALLAFAVLGVGQSRITKQVEELTYRAYRILVHGIFARLVIFVFFGSHIVWSQCLSGLA
jgi:hypothetical protein